MLPAELHDREQDVPLSPEQLAEQLHKFEGYRKEFSTDIERLEGRRSRLRDDLLEYEKLVERVEKLVKEKTGSFETRVDVGCDVTVAARVPDTSRVFVAVGLGFHLELALDEVAPIIEPRCKHLASLIKEVEQRLSDARSCAVAFDSSLQLLKAGEK